MKKLALVVLALGMLACNNGRSSGNDSGTNITLGDTGPAGNDSGSPGNDAGSTPTTCGTFATGSGAWPQLPTGCVPRCTTATGQAYNACVTTYQASGMTMADQDAFDSCTQAAFMADTTPAAAVGDGMGGTVMVSCGGNSTNEFSCDTWQTNAAIDMSCDTEFSAYLQCATAVPTGMDPQTVCASQITTLNGCITTNMTAIQTAAQSLFSMCFG